MPQVTEPPRIPAHLETPGAWNRAPHTESTPDLQPRVNLTATDSTTLSYSFDRANQSLRIVITDKTSGEVLRSLEFKSFHANLHRTDKLSGLLLDRQA
jgi:hypothetical protein